MTIRDEIWKLLKQMNTGDELSDVQFLIGERWKEIIKENMVKFNEGDKVEFTNPKSGEVISGIVAEKGKKFVVVRSESSLLRYKVVPSMLRKKVE